MTMSAMSDPECFVRLYISSFRAVIPTLNSAEIHRAFFDSLFFWGPLSVSILLITLITGALLNENFSLNEIEYGFVYIYIYVKSHK